METLNDSFENFKIKKLATRPLTINQGRSIKVIMNLFDVIFKQIRIYRYNVIFNPIYIDTEDVFRDFIHRVRQYLGNNFYYDNKVIYALREVQGEIEFRKDKNMIKIEYCETLNLNDMPSFEVVMQIMHIMLKERMKEIGYVRVGRKYFPKDFGNSHRRDNDFKLDIWKGYFISLESVMKGMILKVNNTSRLLYKKSMYDIIKEEKKKFRGPLDHLNKYLKNKYRGRCVLAMYSKRIYRIDDIDLDKTPQNTFYWEDINGEISYEEYLMNKWNTKRLKYPSANGMLIHRNKKGKMKNKEILLVPELCFLTGLDRKMKKNPTFMRKVIDYTSIVDNKEKFESFKRIVSDINNSAENNFEISKDMIKTEAKVLPEVEVEIKELNYNTKIVKSNKKLRDEIMKSKFVNQDKGRAQKIRYWKLLYEDSDIRIIDSFKRQLEDIARTMQIWGKELSAKYEDCKIKTQKDNKKYIKVWENEVKRILESDNNLEFVLVILPNNPYATIIYNLVKYLCYVIYGIKCQCLKLANLKGKKSYQVIKGVLKQMMAKNNNRLWRVLFDNLKRKSYKIIKEKVPAMVVGIDVSHDWKSSNSVAAICVSYDSYFCKFWSYIIIQRKKMEIIERFGEVIKKAILRFHDLHKVWVKHIFIFRDGISDSQLSTGIDIEINGLENEINLLKNNLDIQNWDPTINAIVVQKRINIHILNEQFKSVPPGTVVDNKVVNKRHWNFYMVAHSPTHKNSEALPTRYIVMRNDVQWSQNDYEIFCNCLCSQYYNWPGPINIPSVIKYAHRAAYLFCEIDKKNISPHKKIDDTLFML